MFTFRIKIHREMYPHTDMVRLYIEKPHLSMMFLCMCAYIVRMIDTSFSSFSLTTNTSMRVQVQGKAVWIYALCSIHLYLYNYCIYIYIHIHSHSLYIERARKRERDRHSVYLYKCVWKEVQVLYMARVPL